MNMRNRAFGKGRQQGRQRQGRKGMKGQRRRRQDFDMFDDHDSPDWMTQMLIHQDYNKLNRDDFDDDIMFNLATVKDQKKGN